MTREQLLYSFSLKERMCYHSQGLFISIAILYLFYNSYYALVIIPFLDYLYIKRKKKKILEKKRRVMKNQLRTVFSSMRIYLQAGYSIENAIKGIESELRSLYPADSILVKEFTFIVHQCTVNVPLEKLLHEFSNRSGLEEMKDFTTILLVAKRQGGNLLRIVQEASSNLEDKLQRKWKLSL